MNHIRKLAALLIAALLMVSLAAPAFATSPEFEIKDMPLKQWVDVERNEWGVSLYKITLKADARVTVNWRDCTDSGYFFLLFKTSKAAESGSGGSPLLDLKPRTAADGSYIFAARKGTYYAYFICTLDKKPAGQVKITTTALSDRNNYMPSIAYSLKRGTMERILQLPLKSHPCWYKIKTTKAKKILIYTNEGRESQIALYDKNMRLVATTSSAKKVVTTNKCPASVYYIRVSEKMRYVSRDIGDNYITLKWK